MEKYKEIAQIEVFKARRRSLVILCRRCGRICWRYIRGWGSRRYHQVWWYCWFYDNARIIITVEHCWSCSVCILITVLFTIAFCCIICVLPKRTYRFKHQIFGVIRKENCRYYLVKRRYVHFVGIFILLGGIMLLIKLKILVLNGAIIIRRTIWI